MSESRDLIGLIRIVALRTLMERIALLFAGGGDHVDNAVIMYEVIDGFRLGDSCRTFIIPNEDPILFICRSDIDFPIG